MSRSAILSWLALVVTGLPATGCLGPSDQEAAPPGTGPAGHPPLTHLALIPLRDATGEAEATELIAGRLTEVLESAGLSVVDPEAVETALRSRRIRYTDSMSREAAKAIAESTGAEGIVLGTVLAYRPGSDPQVAASLRLLDASSGSRLGSARVSLRGRDFEGLLGVGAITRIEELVDESVTRLAEPIVRASLRGVNLGEPPVLEAPSDAITQYRRAGFHLRDVERLAVLPLSNRSARSEAADVFFELLAHEWFRLGIGVVERAELLAAMVAEKVRSIDALDMKLLERMGARVGTHLFVLGSVESYREDVRVGDDQLPEVELSLRVVDVSSGQILAAASLRRRGDHYATVLGLGVVRDPVALASRAAREIVAVIGD